MTRTCAALALLFAGVVAWLAASLPAPFAFEEALIGEIGMQRNEATLALAFALHYFGKFAAVVVAVVAAVYFYRGEKRMAGYVVSVPALAALLSYLLKNVFERVRPDVLTHLVHQADASFPSGHSTFAAAFAMFFMLRYPRPGVIVTGIALIVGMGWSRLLLGVHYPVDVLAGWSVGAMMALLVYAVYPPVMETKNPFL
ncbi:MAG: phosphatase PAP2 family protein [Cardiobacteriaceae bacterium]|nr:phosphatase PAP2 family protein [Cardiobacteriaceae bacterium]